MSRFLKFIVHFVIILTILDVIALAVPPFLGINTVIVDGSQQSNLPVGSVTYAKPVSVSELKPGDSIISEESGTVYRYKINSIDSGSGVFNVYDQMDVEAGEKSLSLRNTAPKVVITIGYIGYLIIATQSVEGLVIIGLAIIFLIILFILAELWRKDKSDGSVGELEGGAEGGEAGAAAEDAAAERPMTKRQLKKEMKRRAKEEAVQDKAQTKQEIKEATRQLKEEAKARKKEEKRRKKEAKKRARTGGFIEDLDPIEANINMADAPIEHSDVAADEANQVLRQEIAAATQQSREENLGDTKDVVIPKASETETEAEQPAGESAAPEETTAAEEPAEAEQPEDEGPVEYRKIAIPRYTVEELLVKAREEGDTPEVQSDDQYGVTLLDYSDIIIEKE